MPLYSFAGDRMMTLQCPNCNAMITATEIEPCACEVCKRGDVGLYIFHIDGKTAMLCLDCLHRRLEDVRVGPSEVKDGS